MHGHVFVHMHIGCFPGQCPPHNEGQTIEKMISILVDPVADRLYSSLSSCLCFPSPPLSVGFSWLRSCSKHRQAGCKRILQCGITMATATVSDIHNTASGTVDPWDKNSRLGYPLTWRQQRIIETTVEKHPPDCLSVTDQSEIRLLSIHLFLTRSLLLIVS